MEPIKIKGFTQIFTGVYEFQIYDHMDKSKRTQPSIFHHLYKRAADAENSLEKIKRHLASGSGRNLLQGPLLKRSETLRKWNERWVILDPTTGRMEYKIRRNEPTVKGTILFDANSTITLSPVNFHGMQKYDGCYIGTPQKKDYFLCAETPGAARAWVSTLQATQLVLKAHKEAVNSLSGNGSAKLGTVAAVVAAANSTALESSKDVEAAMHISLRNALGVITNKPTDGPMDDFAIMKETLRVKDDELQNLARDLRARDSTIKEIAEKLTETAEAAEAAASAAHTIDEQRRIVCAEIERLKKDSDKQLESSMLKLKDSEEKAMALSKERDQLIRQRDSALQEAHMWRSELAKARERVVILEAAVVRAEEKVRVAEADAEARIKEAVQKESAALKDKQELLVYVNKLQAQLQRHHIDTKQVFEEKSESGNTPLTKHVDLSEENVDKACLSVSRTVPVPGESVVHMAGDQVNHRRAGDGEWSDIQAQDARIADVREIAPSRKQVAWIFLLLANQLVTNMNKEGTLFISLENEVIRL
ncbi:Pleckstrin homology domain-containing protein [Prunus dulcis]|uniref:Pleckstrin homology domain-containing protein n=1 Tax=Prunus dulcis TaxID=3755 RepID=A0A4Y1R6M5_PRUDU|nr:Pleckstrin homology domain-containing protein [Prunus dulcis]